MRYLFILVHLFLIGLIAHVCVTGIYTPFKGRSVPVVSHPIPVVSPDSSAQARHPSLPPDGRRIIQRDLFKTGAVQTSGPGRVKKAAPPKPTRLKLVLTGTVTGSQGIRMAVIQLSKGQPAKAYHEGDKVGPARIRTILRERVILEVAGREEILSMVTKPGPVVPVLPVLPGPSPRTPAPPVPTGENAFKSEVMVDWNRLGTYLAETPNVKDLIRLVPHMVNGEKKGYRIKGFGGKSSIGDLLKLRTGDILVSMNGQPLGSPGDEEILLSVFTQIDKNVSARIGIIRSGISGTLHYAIK